MGHCQICLSSPHLPWCPVLTGEAVPGGREFSVEQQQAIAAQTGQQEGLMGTGRGPWGLGPFAMGAASVEARIDRLEALVEELETQVRLLRQPARVSENRPF